MYYIWKNIFLSTKLHILFLASWFPSRGKPTSGDFVQRHAEAVSTKHNVSVIHVVTDENLHAKIEIVSKIENNVKIIIGYIPKSINPFLKYYYFLSAYKKCLNRISSFDVVHLNVTYPKGIVALYLKWFKKKPYIITEHWTRYLSPQNKMIGFIEKVITKSIIKNASFICPVSKNLESSMMSLGFNGNYISIPNVVDTKLFYPDYNVDDSLFTVTHISHMGNEHKNVDGIINVIGELQRDIPNLNFNLIGENSNKYTKKIRELKIENVNIIDQIPNKEIPFFLKKSNVFVQFSNYENLPCVILEAFSCGVPVVSTDVGGISEFFPKNFGYLIAVKDEKALKNAIFKIYSSELKIDKRIMFSYAEKEFSQKSISSHFSKLYDKALNP